MTYERSTPSFGSSLLLHGAVVGLILFLAYGMNSESTPTPKIFELVAGEGDNYAARAAPALGVPGGIKANIPAAPAQPRPEPASLEVQPVPVAVKPVPAKPANKIPDFTRAVERTATRVANRIEAKYKKELEAEKRRQITQEEYLKEHPQSGTNAERTARLEGEGIRQGVVGGSTGNKTGGAGGKALTREEGTELEAYWAMLIDRMKANLEKPTDVSDALTAEVQFFVSPDGSISEVRVSRTSGNDEFDKAVVEAVHRTRSIGPRPDGQGDRVTVTFKMHEEDASP
jgi:colicin import membrane protein